jgi:hypothetical protein
LKKAGNRQELTYQTKELGARDAWQLTKPLTVKVLSYDVQKNQVNVELETPGRYPAASGGWTPIHSCDSTNPFLI